MVEAKENEIKINEAREHYRPAAARASLLYFVMSDLRKINPIYQFSLKVSLLLETFAKLTPAQYVITESFGFSLSCF